jgi:hypothetical protein
VKTVLNTAIKAASAATAMVLLGLAPGVVSACEYDGAAAAAATAPTQLAATPAPAATRVPTATALKAPAAKPAKQAADKSKEAAPDAKVAVVSFK